MSGGRHASLLSSLILLISVSQIAIAQDVALGEVIDAKGGEIIRRDTSEPWQPITVGMLLYKGDELRTGEFGALALLFNDETQVRLHRSSYFVVDEVRKSSQEPSSFTLLKGALWSRAKAVFRLVTDIVDPNPIVEMNTPTATIGIRGTDWYVKVEPETGTSRVVILTGEATVKNEFGSVNIASGEEATTKLGEAPVKRVVVDIKDKPLFVLEYSPVWLDIISISGLSYTELANRLEDGNVKSLTLAEYQYDVGDFTSAESTLNTLSDIPSDRVALLNGLLLARSGDYTSAMPYLTRASTSPQLRTRILASLALVAVLALQDQYTEAKRALYLIESNAIAEVVLFKSAMEFFAGDYSAAIRLAEIGLREFPTDSRFDIILAHAYLLTDQQENMRTAIDSAFSKDAKDYRAWHTDGLYYSIFVPNAEKVIHAYERAIELNPNAYISINNLALVYWQLGDLQTSGRLLSQAQSVSEDESLIYASQGFHAQALDELDEADEFFSRALEIDPSQPGAISGQAYQALSRGENERAIDLFLKLITINPSYPGAHTGLAIAYYQAGRRSIAISTIERAIELDPNDPIAPKIGSAFAIDNADIARAIPLAQDALEKSLKFDYFAVENLASARTGLTNIGSAYLNLGLTDWANYYAQLAFTPYLADSHALLSNVYNPRGIRATNSALNLSFSLEPNAISVPNRYFEFIREPGDYLTLGGSLGDDDGATSKSGSVTVQGFHRLPDPVSYRMDYNINDNDGFRTNSHAESEALNISVGTRLQGRKHHLLANFFANRTESGAPGAVFDSDPDDTDKTNSFNGSLSYHLRLAFDNRILARASYNKIRTEFTNGAPLGSGANDLLTSLLFQFGETRVRNEIAQGLTDLNAFLGAPCAVTDPCIGVGPDFFGFGPALVIPLPEVIDDDPIVATDGYVESYAFQFRHMLNLHDVDVTYGFEFIPQEASSSFDFYDFNLIGIGDWITNPPLLFEQFPFLTPTGVISSRFDSDPVSAMAYTQARWKANEQFWLEGGVAIRHYDNDFIDPETDIDPRIGVGYRINTNHWLRAAFQSELVLPVPALGYLAPVATMGFVTPITQVFNGSRIENLQLQWDGQWTKRIFTVFRYDQQYIDGWAQLFAPGILGSILVADEAVIRSVELGLNVWLLDRFGFAAKYTLVDSENRTRDTNFGNKLPLTPEDNLSVSLNWIHPRQITSSLSTSFVGNRFSDLANTDELPSYWITSFSLGWQPMDKKYFLGLSINNIFNNNIDLAAGYPAAGRSVIATVQARF